MVIYKMNEKDRITVDTPGGGVRESYRSNRVSDKEHYMDHLTPELVVGSPVYVDDILGVGYCRSEECD